MPPPDMLPSNPYGKLPSGAIRPDDLSVPPGFNRRLFAYPLNFNTSNSPSAQLGANAGVQTLNVAGFGPGQRQVFTHLAFVADGPFLIQITPTDLNAGLFQAPIPSGALLATLDRPGCLPYPIIVAETNQLTVQLTNAFGAQANNVTFVLFGFRDFKQACV